uniref:Uncharacterized protein n=1 Tax=Trichuris muris TaxID=70415 RepID=A0A5S6Q9T9_TRIMR
MGRHLLAQLIPFLLCLLMGNLHSTMATESYHTGSYVIVASRLIRPNLPYAVVVNFLESREPVVVRARVIDAQNRSVAQSWAHDIRPGKLSEIRIEKVPLNLSPEMQYKLFVQGETVSGRVLFHEYSDLEFVHKSHSIFIQTDRGIYKPGSDVHIRVIVVTPDLKPYKGTANVMISDPNGNVIKQHKNMPIESGICGRDDSLKLFLTTEPPLGNWKITASVDDIEAFEEFTVDRYVLPTFEVEVKPPPFATVNGDITVFVTAKYTYGKSVEGNVTVKAHSPWRYYGSAQEKPAEVQKMTTLDYSGEASFRFANEELREHNLINEFGYNQIKFTAVVTEKLTGQMRNSSAMVTVHKYPVMLVITKGAPYLKPGLNYTFMVAAKTQDDQSIPANAARKVYLETHFTIAVNKPVENITDGGINSTNIVPSHSSLVNSSIFELDENGTKVLNIETPSGATSLHIEARYGSEDSGIRAYDYVELLRSPSNSFVQILPRQEEVHLGKMLLFDVRTSSPVGDLVALVTSKKAIVHATKIPMTNLQGTLEFEATAKMAPKSRIVVYGVLPDSKEIIVDALDLKMEGAYTKEISLRITPSKVEPNANVTFSVHAPAQSFVGLLVVDQSALLLKSANDINARVIDNEMMSYETIPFNMFPYQQPIDRRRRRIACFRCGMFGTSASDAYSIFHTSGLIVFTDAFLYREKFPIRVPVPVFYRMQVEPVAMGNAGAVPEMAKVKGSGPLMDGGAPAPRVRVRFPETWIWADLSTDAHGSAMHYALAPDTITSWVANVFSINEEDGLKVAPNTEKLEVFRPFFIRLHLPYSVKRGETIALQILIFNYMSNEKLVTVVLNRQPNSGYEIVNKHTKLEKDKEKLKMLNTRMLKVMPRSSATVFIPIRPTTVGIVKLLVKAFADDAADAIEVPLIVEAEGFPVFYSGSMIINLKDKSMFSQSSLIETPPDMVEDSGKAQVTIIGDIMGPTVKSAKGLIRMPYGCGEQNMVNFVPNIIVMRYLMAVDKLAPELRSKLLKNMESGYQRELTYQRDDSSYSAFGKRDAQGSTWLTAFVVRSFALAKHYIFIDEDKLNSSFKFLESQQKENGMFEENGDVLHKGLQGGSSQGGAPLTAFVFLALLENGVQNSEALNYLEQSLDYISNNSYAVALVSYALHRANSSKRNAAFHLLENLATDKDGFRYWAANVSEQATDKMLWYDKPPSTDVETTAYALLTYLLRNQVDVAFPIVRWLVHNRNALGGFSSTQDTVVALQALADYAERTYTPNTKLAITVRNGDHKALFQVSGENCIILQTYDIHRMSERIDVTAEGVGVAFVQINWRYNMKRLANNQPFICEQKVLQQASNELIVSLCCRYNLSGKSNMAVLEMQTPSGFVINSEQLNMLTGKEYLQRVETDKQETQANVYFSSMNADPICFNISSHLAYQVSDQKPAIVKLYDYYEPSRRIEFDYMVSKEIAINDACGGDCWAQVSSAALISENSSPVTKSIMNLRWALLAASLSAFVVHWL